VTCTGGCPSSGVITCGPWVGRGTVTPGCRASRAAALAGRTGLRCLCCCAPLTTSPSRMYAFSSTLHFHGNTETPHPHVPQLRTPSACTRRAYSLCSAHEALGLKKRACLAALQIFYGDTHFPLATGPREISLENGDPWAWPAISAACCKSGMGRGDSEERRAFLAAHIQPHLLPRCLACSSRTTQLCIHALEGQEMQRRWNRIHASADCALCTASSRPLHRQAQSTFS